jgi:hypothetical protein
MSRALIGLCAFLFMCVLTPSVVRADPVVITTGFLSVTGLTGGPVYSFAGEDFSVAGGGEPGFTAPQLCFPCAGGDLIGLNSTFVGTSLGHGTATINGSTFGSLSLSGNIDFIGSPILLPPAISNISLTAPFTFSGFMFGCEGPHINCTPFNSVFSTELTGQGLATIQLNTFVLDGDGRSLYQFQSVTYNFSGTPIPEPTSILLLTGGLAALGARFRWSRALRSRSRG